MAKTPLIVATGLCFCICQAVPAATTWYVDDSVSESGNGKSWETAFQKIQEGIDAASHGDTLIVAEGTYVENIHFHGKNITLTSTDPLNSDVVAKTIIDGDQSGSVVTFSGTENETCTLSGFTICNGVSANGGGICGEGTLATIGNNVITDNWGDGGGGLYRCDGTIQNNLITGNSADYGGGLDLCRGTIRNNVIAENSADYGGGLRDCSGTIQNNVIAGNSAGDGGGGVYACHTIRNCIIWGNCPDQLSFNPLYTAPPQPAYSCIEDWTGGGEGNIALNPHFVDAQNGDFHLRSWSPCVDAGDPASPFSNEPDFNGGRINMGAYGNTAEAASKSLDTDFDNLPDDWELHWFGSLDQDADGDPDGDFASNIAEYLYARKPTSSAESWVNNATKGTWYATIRDALSEADDGEEIVAYPGIYEENISFGGRNVVLRSTDPLDPAIVASTIIDGRACGSVVTFAGTEDETTVLSGFTIRNGNAQSGGGICGRTDAKETHATIQNNVVTGNSAGYAGGLYRCHGMIRNNIIKGNRARIAGGLGICDGTIQNNTIVGNSASEFGGGLAFCGGTMLNCIVWANTGGQLLEGRVPTYSCIQEWTGGGEGNIALNPRFVDAEDGDFHLRSWSPCIDAGDPTSDFSNEPQPNGGRVNMGAYGNTPEAASKSPDTDADGLPDDWEMHWFGDLEKDGDSDPDGDLIPNVKEYIYAWDPTVPAETIVENLTKGLRYQSIQPALSESDGGDEIVVHQGIYEERIGFEGKNVVLRSTDPSDPDVVANTIIDAAEIGPVVTFSGTEDETCVLSGFTIRNGKADYGGGICGGTGNRHTRATVVHNVVSGNTAWGNEEGGGGGGGLAFCDGRIHNNAITGNPGAGLYDCDGIIANNSITGNGSDDPFGGPGGGLHDCDGVIENNTIAGNWFSGFLLFGKGGGLSGCGGTIRNNTITGNSADSGGGLYGCGGTIRGNIITGNSATGDWYCWGGGGLYGCDGTIENNTIAGNWARDPGGGLYNCAGTIRNCIIWGNEAPQGPQLSGCVQPTYSCIQKWVGDGEGNIPFYPYFVDAENGDFHLQSVSPCIDAGDPSSDFSNEPQPNGGRINMGAYGNTPEATSKSPDTDNDGLPDDWELRWFGNLGESGAGDPDGDFIPNLTEYLHARDPTSSAEPRVNNASKASWHLSVQEALSEAADGDEIIVYPSIYEENIHFGGKNVVLRSTDPSEAGVVASTIIDGRQFGPVVTFSGTEMEGCVLTGFTIRNGRAPCGGGICGGTEETRTHATIQNNVISGNTADNYGGDGGGLAYCDGTVQNNLIAGNSAQYGSGGGLAYCHGAIENNTIAENSAGDDGGALYGCHGDIRNNSITENSAGYNGGGLYSCNGEIRDNSVTGNSAYHGGALYGCDGAIRNNTITGNSAMRGAGLYVCDGTIQSNVISGNSAEWYGGGIAFSDATIQNNLIVGNSAGSYGGGLYGCGKIIRNNSVYGNSAGKQGGGLYECGGTIRNCIIWGNTATEGAQLYGSGRPTYCCIQDWTAELKTNIRHHPHLVDPDAGDYHLRSWSPCIDAGDPASDFSNEPQPNGGRVNMGAYGNTPEAACKSADSDEDGLPDDWEMEFFGHLRLEPGDDPDGDLVPNIEEYRRGLDPTSPTASWYVDDSVLTPGDGTSWETAFKTLQEAINAACAGSVLVVAEGTYVENIHFRGENIALRSRDPSDHTVVANTILDGNQSGPVVTFSGGGNEISLLAGFTVCNGSAATGGGICGNGTNATIRNNVITGNYAHYGGGVHGCDGIIENNGIFGNSARYGGALAECGGTIRRNSIRGNSADMYGGGLARCHGTIEDNIITGNSAGMYGGGLYGCQGTIERNTITRNSADHGGGGLDFCCGIIQNNVIAGNWATWNGGGLYACDGTILNNTIVGNLAGYCGGGLDYCVGTIQNCIIWANHASRGAQLCDSTEPTYSCIQDWAGAGQGNIADDPTFNDLDGPDDDPQSHEDNDYRLSPDSPCVDAGLNDERMWQAADLDGNPRIWCGKVSLTVDMGAYEYGSSQFEIVQVVRPANGSVGLIWNSRPDDTYTVWSRDDLSTAPWTPRATISSRGHISRWTDTAPLGRTRFYRVEIR